MVNCSIVQRLAWGEHVSSWTNWTFFLHMFSCLNRDSLPAGFFFPATPILYFSFFPGSVFFLVDLTLTSSRGSHSMHMFSSCWSPFHLAVLVVVGCISSLTSTVWARTKLLNIFFVQLKEWANFCAALGAKKTWPQELQVNSRTMASAWRLFLLPLDEMMPSC